MTDLSRIPAALTKDVLLEHLYAVINSLESRYGSRVTGMLAEFDATYLMTLLGNHELLRQTVAEAVDAIQKTEAIERKQTGSNRRPARRLSDTESLGETLFQEVLKIEPEFCAQITGMLLEIGPAAVRTFLADPTTLRSAVERAKLECQHRQLCSEQLAESVFSQVVKVYPNNSSKITGMLCEDGAIMKMTNTPGNHGNQEQLRVAMEMCRKALEDTGQWLDE